MADELTYSDIVEEVPETEAADLTARNVKIYINDGTDFLQVGLTDIMATAAEARTYLGIS